MGYNTFVTYTGNGVTTTFAVPFEYISQDEVKATVGGVNASLTFVNPALVQITPAPASGASVVVYRSTKIDSLRSTFQSGTPVPASQLNTNYRQLLNAMQELADFRDTTLPGVQYARTNLGNVPDLDFLNKAIAAGVDTSGGMSGGAISTALNLKADKLNPEFTGTVKVNGSTALGQLNVRAGSGVSAIVLDNPSGTETLRFTSRQVAGFATGYAANATLSLGTTTADTLQFVTNNTIRYTISAVGIHQVNGAGSLGVFNVLATPGSSAIVLDNSAGPERIHMVPRSSTGIAKVVSQNAALWVGCEGSNNLQFVTAGENRGGISGDGLTVYFTGVANSTSGSAANVFVDAATGRLYRSTSGRKYKTNIVDYDPIGDVRLLRPVFYNSADDPDGKRYAGFIAEEVDEAGFDEFVLHNQDGEPDAVHYGNITALLAKNLSEALNVIDDLKARVSALESA